MRKFAIVNFFIGATIAAVLAVLIILGLKIFIPPPERPTYDYSIPSIPYDENTYTQRQNDLKDAQKQYDEDMKTYGGKIFIASNVVGIVILLLGIIAFISGLGTSIGAGTIFAGAYGIGYGYFWGWDGADDVLKFGVGIVITLIVMAGAVVINRMAVKVAAELQAPVNH